MIQLIKGDCLIEMQNIPDKSIDAIICDLPYGTTACRWDAIIPFDKLWEQYKRIIKPNKAIVLFGSEPFSSYLRMSNIEMYKYDWIWYKNKSGNVFLYKISPMKRTENIMVFLNGVLTPQNEPNITFNHNAIMGDKLMKTVMKNEGVQNSGTRKDESYKKYYGNTGYEDNVLKYDVDKNRLHPTQKPIELLKYLIKIYSNENDTVLDNTMGSGSTGIACKLTNRNFIGIEKDEKYFNIAESRINGTPLKPNNFEKVEAGGQNILKLW